MERIVAKARLSSLSPLSQSRYLSVKKDENESFDDFEARIWPEKAHICPRTGQVFIPPMSMKFSIVEGAKYLGEKVKGRGARPWWKHFEAGVLCFDPVLLGVTKDDLQPIDLLCHADGKRGSGKRVIRWFPIIAQWEATVQFEVLDRTITENVFGRALEAAGCYVGVGRFTPRVGGFNGRWLVKELQWLKATGHGKAA